MFIDSHAHLQSPDFKEDLDFVIKQAVDNGIHNIINVSTNYRDCLETIELTQRYDLLYGAVGVHPHDAADMNSDDFKNIIDSLENEKIVAIGEVGLDYYRNYSPRKIQQQVFRDFIRAARDVKKPVLIHNREAGDDVLRMLEEEGKGEVKGVLHCFSEDMNFARKAVDMGFYLSFAGNITFKNFSNTDVLNEIPLDWMLLETDCPFLAPQPFRGRRNQPDFLRFTARRLAEIKGMTEEDVARVTTYNIYRIFGIGSLDGGDRIVYKIGESLYINPTNRCTNHCIFCPRIENPVVKGHNLRLSHEPDVEETIAAIGDPLQYKEIVFCGFGEPLLRLDYLKEVAQWLKRKGAYVRLNTNGHGNLIHNRNIVPELVGLIDEVSISINTWNARDYQEISRSKFGEKAFTSMIEFVTDSRRLLPRVVVTVVGMSGLDIEKTTALAERLGVEHRVRKYNDTGQH